MPLCILQTNISDWDIPEDVHVKLSQVVSDVLHKPEERMTVIVQGNVRMCRSGSSRPTACLQVWTRGSYAGNQAFSKPIYDFLSNALQLPFNRITLVFHDSATSTSTSNGHHG